MRVLVVEDFGVLRESLTQGLLEAGYVVDAAADGERGLWHARNADPDVIVLDLMLPKVDGLTMLRRLRKEGKGSAVLLLTARDTPEDRVLGLDSGADDYLVKPFVFSEFLARVRALIRRRHQAPGVVVRVKDLELDTVKRSVRRAGTTVRLSAREYAILEFLSMNLGKVVTRSELWQHVYDFNASLESNVVDVHVGNLRRKLDAVPGAQGTLIETRRGQGYVMGGQDAEVPE